MLFVDANKMQIKMSLTELLLFELKLIAVKKQE
jgi:hypothetical protein